jgi:precorrin-6B methylase 2
MEPGGRYFTPRHLTRWSIALLDIIPGYQLVDFACGSGGFLVAAAEKMPQVTGVEISPNWARLAFTNCLLHGFRKPDIRIGNSLSIFGRREKEEKFNGVLMNPPFGAKVDDSLVSLAFDFKLSGRSETVLTALAYNHLAELGQMVVFLPSGSLFANSGGEQILREGWIENGELAAVITLPKDAFQPYSQVVTHALLIEKTQQPTCTSWFFQPRFDGFTSGRNRQPDPEHNDLPLITAAIGSLKDSKPVVLLTGEQHGLVGHRILLPDENERFQVNRITRLDTSDISFLLEHGADSKHGYYWIDPNDVRNFDSQTTPITLVLPTQLGHEMNETFLQGAFSFKLTGESGEIRSDRGRSYPIQMPAQWDESVWMGVVIDPDGYPVGPAFQFIDLPNRIEEEGETVFAWDYEIPFGDNQVDIVETMKGHGCLVLFPPNKLQGVKIAKREYLFTSGKHHWIRVKLGQDNSSKLDIFVQDDNSSIFESDGRQCGVVFTWDGEVLGVAIPGHVIQETENIDLQPISYFPRKREVGPVGLESPAQILADIQKAQLELVEQVGKLLALAEMKSAANEIIPPRQVILSPVGNMQGIQKEVWEVLQTIVDNHKGEIIPKPFRTGDIQSEIIRKLRDDLLNQRENNDDNELGLEPYTHQDLQIYIAENTYTDEDLERTLDLFERMGVLVRVLIDGAQYYRLVSEREFVAGNLK